MRMLQVIKSLFCFFSSRKTLAHFDSITEHGIVVTTCQKETIILIEKKRLYIYDNVQKPDTKFFFLFSRHI
jgi:hypothetical protein